MIEGVKITPLKQIPDERGKVMHMLRRTDAHFEEFGEVYFSVVFPGVIKGWHLHKRMTINYAVPYGRIKLVLFDGRRTSSTKGRIEEIFMGEDNYCLVTIPPFVWNGFKGYGPTEAIVCNCATTVHDPDEIERMDPIGGKIPYDWNLKHE